MYAIVETQENVLKMCAFQYVNFTLNTKKLNIDLLLMLCVLMYLEGNALMSGIHLEINQKQGG